MLDGARRRVFRFISRVLAITAYGSAGSPDALVNAPAALIGPGRGRPSAVAFADSVGWLAERLPAVVVRLADDVPARWVFSVTPA